MGPYGSIWSHTLRIRSHMGYKGSGMAKMGLGFHIISKYSLDVGFKTFSQKNSKNLKSPEPGRGAQKS